MYANDIQNKLTLERYENEIFQPYEVEVFSIHYLKSITKVNKIFV